MTVFEQEQIKYSCMAGSRLIGNDLQKCNDQGLYMIAPKGTWITQDDAPEAMSAPPKCISVCSLNLPFAKNSARAVVGDQTGALSDKEVVEGTELQYTCRKGCVQTGGNPMSTNVASIKCQSDGKFDFSPPKCLCKLDFKILAVNFGSALKDASNKANQIKLKFFPISVA